MKLYLFGLAFAGCLFGQTIDIQADLTDAPRKLVHAHLKIPVHAGPLTLVYPEWIPGEHGPTGPVDNMAGLVFTANGKQLAWTRDDVNMYAIRVTVPEGATELDANLDFLAVADPSGFSAGASTTPNLAVLSWNQVLLYPAGMSARDVKFRPSVKLPDGWQMGTALTHVSENQFAPVTLETLVDSPVLAGRYFKEVPLAPDVTPKHFLDIAADGPEYLAITKEQELGFSNLVREAGALFQSRHYNSYHFLLTLSDSVAHFGLEHHQSSDDRADARTLIDEDFNLVNADLLPHEFTHSWNGKYRRPAGLATENYQQPMKGELLWVYEGLTQYLGDVLAARSGLWTAEQFRDYLAASAAEMDHRPGRTWRDLQDTATAAQILYSAPLAWDNWRRATDYYPEGELVWLDADTLIRKLSNGAKSINDFCALFYSVGGNTAPAVLPYTFDDVVKALSTVQPYGWASFLKQRLTSKAPHAPLDGITRAGYQISYTPEVNDYIRAAEGRKGGTMAWYSLGFNMGSDGTIGDVLIGSPAFKAGLGPGMKVVAVNSRRESDELLRAAIRNAEGSTAPIELIIQNDDTFRVVKVDYRGGERFPHLVGQPGAPDMLADIIKPMTAKH